MMTICITTVYNNVFLILKDSKNQTQDRIRNSMALESSRGLYFYIEVLKTALNDEIVTNDEASILKVLATALGLSPSAAGTAMDIARGVDPNPIDDNSNYLEQQIGDVTTYQTALVAALDDEVISEDEWAMLDSLRKLLSIQPDQHALIEEAIRSMSETDVNGERRLERLQRFNTVCPYV